MFKVLQLIYSFSLRAYNVPLNTVTSDRSSTSVYNSLIIRFMLKLTDLSQKSCNWGSESPFFFYMPRFKASRQALVLSYFLQSISLPLLVLFTLFIMTTVCRDGLTVIFKINCNCSFVIEKVSKRTFFNNCIFP